MSESTTKLHTISKDRNNYWKVCEFDVNKENFVGFKRRHKINMLKHFNYSTNGSLVEQEYLVDVFCSVKE